MNAEVREDLASQSNGADDAPMAVLVLLQGAQLLVVEQARRIGRAVQLETAAGVVQVDDGPAAGFGDHAHGLVEDFPAPAVRIEDIARGAAGMDANQHRPGADGAVALVAAERPVDQGQVAFSAIHFALVGDHAEGTVTGVDHAFAGAGDVTLILQAIADQFGDGEHLKAVLVAELDQVGDAGHGTVVLHDLADHAGGIEAGEAGEIDGGLGLPGADQDAALAGAEGEDMAGTGQIAGRGARRDGGPDGMRPVVGGDAGSDALARLNGLGEGGAEARGVLLGHGRQIEEVGALLCQREADEAAAESGHEVDGFGSDEFGREGQVAFVLAVFVVDDDQHPSSANLIQRCRHIDEGKRGRGARARGNGRIGERGHGEHPRLYPRAETRTPNCRIAGFGWFQSEDLFTRGGSETRAPAAGVMVRVPLLKVKA